MKASTSQFCFINPLPLLQDTFLCFPQPRLIFMQHLSWPVQFKGLLSPSKLLSGYTCCCSGQRLRCPEAPAPPRGPISAMVSGLCSCHSDKHKQPLFFLPPGGTGPGFPRGWPESVPGGLGHGAEPACGALFLLHGQQGMQQ